MVLSLKKKFWITNGFKLELAKLGVGMVNVKHILGRNV